jgi:hypothetical protein
MALVKKVRDENPGMSLKDVLRLASKMRGKSSSGKSSSEKKHKKRGGMAMLGGATVGATVGVTGDATGDATGNATGDGDNAAKLTVAPEVAGGGRKSKKRSKKSKKSRKSKSRSKRRH